jgi:hypothetical protein
MGKKFGAVVLVLVTLLAFYFGLFSSKPTLDLGETPSGPEDAEIVDPVNPGPNGDIQSQIDPEAGAPANPVTEDAPVSPLEAPAGPIVDQPLVIPPAVITSLNNCLNVQMSNGLQDLGEPVNMRERWVDYAIKMADGKERRVHIENFEEDSGKIKSSLVVYDLDGTGEPIPVTVDPRDQDNPSQDVVQNYVSQGQLKTKESSNLNEYSGGIKVETVLRQGKVYEIEFERDGQFFRCDQVEKVNTCFCSK